jgi:putative FmdB family regulatory protein
LPIREYSCSKCGNVFENIEIEVTTGNVVCPNCGSRNVEQVFSIFSSSTADKTSCDVSSRFT